MAPSLDTGTPKFLERLKGSMKGKRVSSPRTAAIYHTVLIHPESGQLRIDGCIVEPEPGMFGVLRLDGVELLVEYTTKLPCALASSQGGLVPEVLYVRPTPSVSSLKEGMNFTVFINSAHFLVKVKQVLGSVPDPVSREPVSRDPLVEMQITDVGRSNCTPAVRVMKTPLQRHRYPASPESLAPNRQPYTPLTPSPLSRLAELVHTPASSQEKPLPTPPSLSPTGVSGNNVRHERQNTDTQSGANDNTNGTAGDVPLLIQSIVNLKASPSAAAKVPSAGPASRRSSHHASRPSSRQSQCELLEVPPKRTSMDDRHSVESVAGSAPGSPTSTRTPSLRRVTRIPINLPNNRESERNVAIQPTSNESPKPEGRQALQALSSSLQDVLSDPAQSAEIPLAGLGVSRWSRSRSASTSSRRSRLSVQERLQQEDTALTPRASSPQHVHEEVHLHTQYYPTQRKPSCGSWSGVQQISMTYTGYPEPLEGQSPEQLSTPRQRRRTLSKHDSPIEALKHGAVVAGTDIGVIGTGRPGRNALVQPQGFFDPAILPSHLRGDLPTAQGAQRKGKGKAMPNCMEPASSPTIPPAAINANIPLTTQVDIKVGTSRPIYGTEPIPQFPIDTTGDAMIMSGGCRAVLVTPAQAQSILEVAYQQPHNRYHPIAPGMPGPSTSLRF
ncbi:hypothetical protein NLJ89_g2693 [Agrocybe chaxingu]|uniref:Uncharacterized protein n=1 Tax=Agrocybe chaxingu TaxID=84603 RepID=A0A9W8KAV1_9AGAR|nr:hypothetical protein NLJ89_g2693 [Agrocybe chaxingu]